MPASAKPAKVSVTTSSSAAGLDFVDCLQRSLAQETTVKLSTADQVASVVGGCLALAAAIYGVWAHLKRRRTEKAERAEAETAAFIAELNKPSPEAIKAQRLQARNQIRYYEPRRMAKRTHHRPDWAYLLAIALIAIALYVALR
jgi:hypothetical protein